MDDGATFVSNDKVVDILQISRLDITISNTKGLGCDKVTIKFQFFSFPCFVIGHSVDEPALSPGSTGRVKRICKA